MTDYSSIISKVIDNLPNGEQRFILSEYPFNYSCIGVYQKPHFSERLLSDSGVSTGNKEIEKEFNEEIELLEKFIEEADIKIDLADWQSDSRIKDMEKLYKVVNRTAFAIQLWDWYAIPWRYRNDLIHVIYSPNDVMGTPIIHSFPAQEFLALQARAEENKMLEVVKLIRKNKIWHWIAIGSLMAIALITIWKL